MLLPVVGILLLLFLIVLGLLGILLLNPLMVDILTDEWMNGWMNEYE